MKLFLQIVLLYLKNFWNFIFTPSPKWVDIKGYLKAKKVTSKKYFQKNSYYKANNLPSYKKYSIIF